MPTSLARVITTIGAALVVVGVFLDWIEGLSASHIPISRLVRSEMERESDSFFTSIGVILVGAAVVGMLGVLLPARIPAFLAAVVTIAVTVLLLVQEYNFLPEQLDGDVVGAGVWVTAAGAVALLIGSTGLAVDVQREVLHP